jgi:hypothetical protein
VDNGDGQMYPNQRYYQWRNYGWFVPSMIILLSLVGIVISFIIILIYYLIIEPDPLTSNFYILLSSSVIILSIIAIGITSANVKLSINNLYFEFPINYNKVDDALLGMFESTGIRYYIKKTTIFHAFFNIQRFYCLHNDSIHIIIKDRMDDSTLLQLGPDTDENKYKIKEVRKSIETFLK